MAWGEPMIARVVEDFYRLQVLRKKWAERFWWYDVDEPAPEEKETSESPSKEAK